MSNNLLLTFTAALIVASACSCAKPTEDYLGLGSNSRNEELSWVSERIDSGDWGHDIQTLASNLRIVSELTLDAALDGVESIKEADKFGVSTYESKKLTELYWVLSSLQSYSYEEPHFVKCSNQQAEFFIEIVDLKFGGLKKFQETLKHPLNNSLLFNYLQEYGREHLKDCAISICQRFEEVMKELPHDLEAKLDALISMGEQYPPEEAETRLIAQAESLNLAEDKFDAQKMLTAARQYVDEHHTRSCLKSAGPGKLLASFITETCYILRSRTLPFDMYNLARVLVPHAISSLEIPIKFRKLNEYSRICIPFSRILTEEAAEENVVDNMPREGIEPTLVTN